jgi:hypothetical protein
MRYKVVKIALSIRIQSHCIILKHGGRNKVFALLLLFLLFHFRTDFPTKKAKATNTMHIRRNIKNSALAIVTDAAAIPVKPRIPAIMAMMKKNKAHFSILCLLKCRVETVPISELFQEITSGMQE